MRPAHPYLDGPRPRALAHRGGALLPANVGIENTLEAFRNAVDLGYTYVETDVHASRDGVVYTFHDPDLHRMTGEPTPIEALEAARLDAFRLAGRAAIPRLSAVLEQLPGVRLNIDVKSDAAVEPTIRTLRDAGATDRVLLAGFSPARLRHLRRLAPEIATSCSPLEVARIKLGLPVRGPLAAQVPERRGRVHVVTRRFVRRAHRRGIEVHVWTVDEPAAMHRLLDLGVDGIVTDRPDVLRDVLRDRGEWRGSAPEE